MTVGQLEVEMGLREFMTWSVFMAERAADQKRANAGKRPRSDGASVDPASMTPEQARRAFNIPRGE